MICLVQTEGPNFMFCLAMVVDGHQSIVPNLMIQVIANAGLFMVFLPADYLIECLAILVPKRYTTFHSGLMFLCTALCFSSFFSHTGMSQLSSIISIYEY